MKNLLKRLVREEEGQDLIEYALVAAIIMVGSIAIIQNIGGMTQSLWGSVQSSVAVGAPAGS